MALRVVKESKIKLKASDGTAIQGRIYQAAPPAKTLTSIPWGYHAEYMAMFDRDKFDAWLKATVGKP